MVKIWDLFRQMTENGRFIPSNGRKWGIYSVRWPKMGDLFRQMARNGDLFRQITENGGFIPSDGQKWGFIPSDGQK